MQPAPLAGTATPSQAVTMPVWFGCNPHPSRGRQQRDEVILLTDNADATRTPYGDGKVMKLLPL